MIAFERWWRSEHPTQFVAEDGSAREGAAAVFLGEGFDPVDGASRVAILKRSASSLFATATVGDEVAAVVSDGRATVLGASVPTIEGSISSGPASPTPQATAVAVISA